MNCQEVVEFMQRQLDEDLNPEEEAQLADHLGHCSDCPELYHRLKLLSRELTSLPKVIPAYSLVDAILPKLDEIDKQNAASSQSMNYIPARQRTRSIPGTRRFGSVFSWKAAGGVVAAGLVLGIFLFQTNHTSSDQADTFLAPGKDQKSASASRQNQENSNSDTKDRLTASPNGNNQAFSAQNQSGTPPVSGSNTAAPTAKGMLAQPSTTPKVSDKPTAQPKQTGKPGVSGNNSAAPASQAPTATAAASAPAQGGPGTEPPAASANPKATVQPDATAEPSAAAAEASPAPDTSKRIMSITSIMPEETLRSKDGKYLAAIDQHKVTIKDQDSQEIIFTSERVWQETDKVTLLVWSEDGKLTYQVVNDSSTQNFEIDAVHKTETLLK